MDHDDIVHAKANELLAPDEEHGSEMQTILRIIERLDSRMSKLESREQNNELSKKIYVKTKHLCLFKPRAETGTAEITTKKTGEKGKLGSRGVVTKESKPDVNEEIRSDEDESRGNESAQPRENEPGKGK